MANNVQQTKSDIRSSLESIKSINDNTLLGNGDSAVKDLLLKDLPSQKGQYGKKLSDLQSKISKKKENQTNIFSDLTDICDSFLGTSQKYSESKFKLANKQRLRQIIDESVGVTIKSAPQSLIDISSEVLFAGDGICGSSTLITGNTINIQPSEFDFLNVLTIDPLSNSGQIVYESISTSGIQMNRQLHGLFTGGTLNYTINNGTLFSGVWSDPNQYYTFSGFSGNTVGDLKHYYSNIQHTDISEITRMSMLMLLLGDGTESKLFDAGFNDLNRLLDKLFKVCNNPNTNGLNQNSPQFNESDEDIEFYFNFDEIEGIDLDDESRRYRKVLKFVDCNNVEVPSRPQHIEDFVYLSEKDLNSTVNDVLENVASNAFHDSGGSASLENFHINILNNFNLNMPKAMIGAVLSPKYLLPIVMVYKLVNGGLIGIKELMKKLYKLFFKLIKKLYWKFITEFWKRVKKDLLDFLKITALNILREKFKRYYAIIASLIALLTKILETNLDNCSALYTLISRTIETALSGASFNINPAGFLLSLASNRSGYSPTRAIDKVTKMANKMGVDTKPIYGNTNKLNHVFSSVIRGHDHEESINSKVMSGNQLSVIPVPGLSGPIVILPGQIKMSGIKF